MENPSEYLLNKPNCSIRINKNGYTSYNYNLHDFVKLNSKLINESNCITRRTLLKEQIKYVAENYDNATKRPVNTYFK